MKPPCPSYRFVDDLIPLILESHDHWWPRDLLALATVSLGWLPHVRRRLYFCPAVHSFKGCFILARTLQENPHILPYIQGLDLKPTSISASPLGAQEMAGLRLVLGLEGLRSVTLGGELAVRSERFLLQIGFPESITNLSIDGTLSMHKAHPSASLEWDDGLTFRFRSLKSLRLSHLYLDLSYTSTPLALADISLENVEIDGFLTSLSDPSTPLRLAVTLSDTTAWDAEQTRAVMEECCLESFQYEVRGNGHHHRQLFDVDDILCPSLQHLSLSEIDIDYSSLIAIAQAFPNLRSVDFEGRAVRITPDEWESFITSGALHFLQNLRLPWSTNYPPFSPWSAAKCAPILMAASSRQLNLSPRDKSNATACTPHLYNF
ncbi:hypothetical protein HGRIS_007684 [Hohenbuehelia grisea]|uniref:F-box domain-containing protein n=1 Tax=Hohenbuehelia grisea TaxID=104357 RepID=A0ABR3J5L5_9AGAR